MLNQAFLYLKLKKNPFVYYLHKGPTSYVCRLMDFYICVFPGNHNLDQDLEYFQDPWSSVRSHLPTGKR